MAVLLFQQTIQEWAWELWQVHLGTVDTNILMKSCCHFSQDAVQCPTCQKIMTYWKTLVVCMIC